MTTHQSQMETSRRGLSAISKKSPVNPREIIVDLVEDHPKENKERLFQRFEEIIDERKDYQQAINWYFFINMYEYMSVAKARGRNRNIKNDNSVELRTKIETIKTEVLLLNLEMPNGKRLRYCEGHYVVKLGGGLAKAGKKAGNKRIGEVFDEASLRQCMGL